VVETSNNIISQSAPVWTERNGKKLKEIITLDFREVSFQAEDGNIYKRYIIDTLLQNKLPSLTIDEMKALYINMVMRMRTEKGLTNPKSEEFAKAIGEDPFYNALQVKYGYAFTCHKSQGGEWNTVYVDFSKRTGLDADSLRWKYTAITRASKMLWCINLPDITPIATLRITPI
ncbi:ATP-binding domain-containing protein, partial [Bacteroides ovatus]